MAEPTTDTRSRKTDDGQRTTDNLHPPVIRLTTPMPWRPRSVHAYLASLGDGSWLLLDGGIDSREAWEVLDAGVREVAGGWDAVAMHVVSHMHLDHIGLAHRIGEVCDAPLAMGELDAQRAAHAAAEPGEEAEYRAELLRRVGAPAEVAATIQQAAAPAPDRGFRAATIQLPSASAPLPGIADWRVVWTPGHTAGHISLFRESDRLLLAGDAVLPRITPTIGVNRQREDPVGDYLAALDRLDALDPALALCGHGDPLEQPRERIRELREATVNETARVLAALGPEPLTCWQVVDVLYADRDLPVSTRMLALRETLAHLQHAARIGTVQMTLESGTARFSVV